MRYFLLLILIILYFQNTYAQAWELKKSSDSIEVYTRTVNNSPIKEFKAVGTIAAGCADILGILKDVPSYSQWIEDVNYSETISSSEDSLSFYYQMDLPWPVKDRDMALDMRIQNTAKEVTVSLTSNPGLVPVSKDYIRMTQVEGEWIITTLNDSTSYVQHRFLADPEGSLPAWVVNLFIVDGPFQTMKNLREFVKARAE
jgi:hypothetical protein